MTETPLPPRVRAALDHAATAGFPLSCEPEVGALLAALAAAVPPGGRVLELGTGTGVGTAWLLHGLGERTDVELVTVDVDAAMVADVRERGWPAGVRFEVGDALDVLRRSEPCDLIFADAPAGKIDGLDVTLSRLRPGGVLVVDDMTSPVPEEYVVVRERVRRTLLDAAELAAVELAHGSGVIVAVRRR